MTEEELEEEKEYEEKYIFPKIEQYLKMDDQELLNSCFNLKDLLTDLDKK